MEEPRSGIVSEESYSDFISSGVAQRHDISDNRVVEVVERTIGAADYMEIVPVQMNRMLLMEVTQVHDIGTAIRGNLLGRQRQQRSLSAQRSCSHRDHRYCLWEEDPTRSGHH